MKTKLVSVLRASDGFTLIEITIVIGVLIALMALSLPIMGYAFAKGRETATEAVIHQVSAAIINDPRRVWTVIDGSQTKVYRIWDVNDDGLIDGDPNVFTPSKAWPSGVVGTEYTGLLGMLSPPMPARFVDANKQVTDAWGNPLRIAYEDLVYGAAGFGIWSVGPDGVTDVGERVNDIRSWERTGE